jgi:hypothetical protein
MASFGLTVDLGKNAPNTACTGQVRAFAHTFGSVAPTADSASGGFVRQFPPLPVTPAVGPPGKLQYLSFPFRGDVVDILTVSIEIIQTIVDVFKWVIEKATRRPKIAAQRAQDFEWDTTSSLLSIVLKPAEPFLILFTNHSIILLALLVVGGLMVKLNLDRGIGVFLIGLIFALGGAGNLVVIRKDTEDVSCIHYLLYTSSISILLFGMLVSIGALLLMIVGVSVNPTGR